MYMCSTCVHVYSTPLPHSFFLFLPLSLFSSLPPFPPSFPSLPAALSQAGQQMEDSVVAAYCALVLGLLAKHNLVSVPALHIYMYLVVA